MKNEILDHEANDTPPIYAKKSIRALLVVIVFYTVITIVYFYTLNALAIIGNSAMEVRGGVIWLVLIFGIGNLIRGLYYGIKSISEKENSILKKYIGTFGSVFLIIATLFFFSGFLFNF